MDLTEDDAPASDSQSQFRFGDEIHFFHPFRRQLEPANIADAPEDADLGQLEPAYEGDSPKEVNIGQLESSDEGSRPSRMEVDNGEPVPRANEDGALAIAGDREPRRMNFEDIRRRVLAGHPNPALEDDVPRVLLALLGEGDDLRERVLAWERWVVAGREMIDNLRRGVDSLESLIANLRQVMHMEVCIEGKKPADEKPADDPK